MDWLFKRFHENGDAPCLATKTEVWTYRELQEGIDEAFAAAAAAGVSRGHSVALLTDYSLPGIAWLFALAQIGAMVVPISTTIPEEIEVRLKSARVEWRVDFSPSATITAVATTGGVHPLIQRLCEAARPGLILFSSGSTGMPKAMVHDLATLIEAYREKRARQLTMLIFLMFDHIGGLNTLLHSLASGLCIAIPSSRDPEDVAALIASRRVNVLPASPTFLNLLLISQAHLRHDLSSLRIITYGTEAMPAALLQRLRDAFQKVKFIQTFGTSETGITQTSSESSSSTLIRLDDPNVETRIVEGELWIRSKTQVLGYLNHSMENFTEDGWFQTGDLVEQRADGYLRIVGRRKELINVGGLKVIPGEVETVLLEMPEIADCMVYGEPNAITGQAVAVQVVLAAGANGETLKARMRAHCRGRVDAYKIPVRLRVVDRTAFGERFKKIRRQL